MEWMKDGRRIIMAKDGALYFGIKLKDGENFTSFLQKSRIIGTHLKSTIDNYKGCVHRDFMGDVSVTAFYDKEKNIVTGAMYSDYLTKDASIIVDYHFNDLIDSSDKSWSVGTVRDASKEFYVTSEENDLKAWLNRNNVKIFNPHGVTVERINLGEASLPSHHRNFGGEFEIKPVDESKATPVYQELMEGLVEKFPDMNLDQMIVSRDYADHFDGLHVGKASNYLKSETIMMGSDNVLYVSISGSNVEDFKEFIEDFSKKHNVIFQDLSRTEADGKIPTYGNLKVLAMEGKDYGTVFDMANITHDLDNFISASALNIVLGREAYEYEVKTLITDKYKKEEYVQSRLSTELKDISEARIDRMDIPNVDSRLKPFECFKITQRFSIPHLDDVYKIELHVFPQKDSAEKVASLLKDKYQELLDKNKDMPKFLQRKVRECMGGVEQYLEIKKKQRFYEKTSLKPKVKVNNNEYDVDITDN